MATPLLTLDPVSDGYSYSPENNIVVTKLDGGPSRRRRDFINNTCTVNAQWVLDQGQYTLLMGFFRERVQFGSKQFRMNLVSDVNVLCPHLCFTGGQMPQLTQQRGNAFWVSCTLEVTPNPTKSFSLFLQNVAVPQMVDAGTVDYSGDLSAFPTTRSVLLTGTSATVSGTPINLDGTYTIATAPNIGTRTFGAGAAVINPQWTVLNGLGPQAYFPATGAAILLPE